LAFQIYARQFEKNDNLFFVLILENTTTYCVEVSLQYRGLPGRLRQAKLTNPAPPLPSPSLSFFICPIQREGPYATDLII